MARDDLLFRVVMWEVAVHYLCARPAECDEALECAAEIAARLGSPRFVWEVELSRSYRLLDHGEREAGEALMRSAGAKVRRLRPDIHITVELFGLTLSEWLYDGRTEPLLAVCSAREAVGPLPFISASVASVAALLGDHDGARRKLAELLAGDGEQLRWPDVHMPATIAHLALAATTIGERSMAPRLRSMLEPLRPNLLQAAPMMFLGQLPGWLIGRLELTAGQPATAVEELRAAVARADEIELLWMRGWARVDLAVALHRSGDPEQALAMLAEAQALADRFSLGLIANQAALACAELEGRDPLPAARAAERPRMLRAITARTGRRTLATLVRGLDDPALERRFGEPGRQRALLRAQARAFQPAEAAGFRGIVAYELEPFAIEMPPDAPCRWAIELDAPAGRARLVEPAPLDADVTLHIGLADWVRMLAGIQNPLHVLLAGRITVEGDVKVAARLEAMFGAG